MLYQSKIPPVFIGCRASDVVSKDSSDIEIRGEKNKLSYCSYLVPKETAFRVLL